MYREAKILDDINENNMWKEVISKEMANVKVSFDILEPDQDVPAGYTKSSGHMIFDVKMDFTRKTR